jgi:hypothetical protein
MTQLVDLRLMRTGARVTANVLSNLIQLTRLDVAQCIEPGALAGKTRLQHLDLSRGCLPPENGAAQAGELLSRLHDMQQLTQLNLAGSLTDGQEDNPPAAAYAALTACLRKQQLAGAQRWLQQAASGCMAHVPC